MVMFKKISILTMAFILCLQLIFNGPAVSAAEPQVKELNIVFLHGAGGNPCGPQLLADSILAQIPDYIAKYEAANPGIEIQVNTMDRCYPNSVDVQTWAQNISDSIDKYFSGRGNLVFIGHSMGGKSALYAVAHNVGGLTDRTAAVVTVNTPVKHLDQYQLVGGGSFTDFCRAGWLILPDAGVCGSVGSYDSSDDGKWVGQNKHWLAFISGERAPLSGQFDYPGFDPYPRDMDDGALPMSAMYSDGADVVYYGEHGHSDFTMIPDVATPMATSILDYIFGNAVLCSVPVRSGGWQHKAGFFLGTDVWQDTVGDVLGQSSSLTHFNPSLTAWQEWEDTINYVPPTYENQLRSRFDVTSRGSIPLLTKLVEARWLVAEDPPDCRLYIKTRAAPQTYIEAFWNIYIQGQLPEGKQRDHYEVEITAGTALASIDDAGWQTDNPRDVRLSVTSRAERPFRWYQATWRVYSQEPRQWDIIGQLPVTQIVQNQ